MRPLALALILAFPTAACGGPASRDPEPAPRSVTAACGGGLTGGSGGVTLLVDGSLYRWQRSRPNLPADSTLVRTDSALAADVFRRLQRMHFMRIDYMKPGNMTCWLSETTDSAEHRVAWSLGDKRVPADVQDVFERVRGAVGLAAAAPPLRAQQAETAPSGWPADSVAVHHAVTRFLTAFENLEWEPFRQSFDENATMFFPTPEPPDRFVGRAAIEGRFRKVFDAIRGAATSGPPYHRLAPEELRIERLGPEAVLVSFLLRNSERVARRTLVFTRSGDRWRIVHLHASNTAVKP